MMMGNKSKIDIENMESLLNMDPSKEYIMYKGDKRMGIFKPESIFNIKSVKDIIESKEKYIVRSYQRGYRWGTKEVEDLLNDIKNIDINSKIKSNYSLQPLVLSKTSFEGEDYIEIIDGQQRLTTIYIILKYLGKNPKFEITYETREKSKQFLTEINKNIKHEDNIDYYYFKKTHETVKRFFKDIKTEKDNWYNKLIDEDSGAVFIEYFVNKSIDSRKNHEIFTNLNAGKIPLENSELIKALFLKEGNYDLKEGKRKIIEISTEWDNLEIKLRDKNFWSWLGQEETDSPHIDFLFDIVAEKFSDTSKGGDYYSYEVFKDKIENDKEKISEIWKEIKKCFMVYNDWYTDIHNYHYLGFLNYINKKITKKKTENYYILFLESDHKNIFKNIIKTNFLNKILLENLSYESDQTYDVLLLFNLLTYIENNQRFDFFKYSKNDYDIEHIYPQSSMESLENSKNQEKWINAVKESGLFGELIEKFDTSNFHSEYLKIIEYYNEKDSIVEDVNDLGNLCLLNQELNRSIKNQPFPIKVQQIIKDDNRLYVLQATKNSFLKYYSDININNYMWSEKDSINYKNKIIETINSYFQLKKER